MAKRLLYFNLYNARKPEGNPSGMLCIHNMMGICQNVIMGSVVLRKRIGQGETGNGLRKTKGFSHYTEKCTKTIGFFLLLLVFGNVR